MSALVVSVGTTVSVLVMFVGTHIMSALVVSVGTTVSVLVMFVGTHIMSALVLSVGTTVSVLVMFVGTHTMSALVLSVGTTVSVLVMFVGTHIMSARCPPAGRSLTSLLLTSMRGMGLSWHRPALLMCPWTASSSSTLWRSGVAMRECLAPGIPLCCYDWEIECLCSTDFSPNTVIHTVFQA